MSNYVRYRIIKPIVLSPEEVLKPGDEITVMNGRIYYNGGLIMPAFYNFLKELVMRCEEDPNFTSMRRIPIPYNKC